MSVGQTENLQEVLNPEHSIYGSSELILISLRNDEIRAALGPLSKALNPALLLGGIVPLLSVNSCKSLWIKVSVNKDMLKQMFVTP